MNAFERYAPFIQDYIYRSGWRSLRAVQAAAADAIFDTDDNVLLLASTASGKTEAAFFPILTQLYENPPSICAQMPACRSGTGTAMSLRPTRRSC